MISSMASVSSASSATVRVEKATSEFLIGPDWTMNIDICDTINSNQMLAKDVVKAVKKRLQHKNPKVQLLALTLLESMVKNCGDYVHFQVAERNILQEMVKIVKKKTDMHVRDKILTLIVSWKEAFGGSGGRYPQYYVAYEDLRGIGVEFPRHSTDAAPIFTPPITQPIPRYPQPGYGMPSSSSKRLDEAMAAEENLSSSTLDSMREVLNLLIDMLLAIDPSKQAAVKDEVIVDLVERCQANQRKLMQMLTTTGDDELLGQGLELNDSLQVTLAKHEAIASGSSQPQNVVNVEIGTPKKHDSSLQPAEADAPNATCSSNPSTSLLPAEEDEEEDDFAILARRHLKIHMATTKVSRTTDDANEPPVTSSAALVPVTTPAPVAVQTKDEDIIDLLSINLSTETSTQPHGHMPLGGSSGISFSENYVAPWAQPRAQQLDVRHHHQPAAQQLLPSMHSSYPPPPWATTPTPDYLTNPDPLFKLDNTSFTPTSTSSSHIQVSINGDALVRPNPRPVTAQKPFIPSYRLFEDLNVFGNADKSLITKFE